MNLVSLCLFRNNSVLQKSTHQRLTECKTRAENMQISFCFCKTCICLKILENIQISVNMIDRRNVTDEYLVKCDFILNTVIFTDAALNISFRKF